MARTDYYAILQVARDASEDDIRSAYRKLARQYHPDVNTAEDAHVHFKEVTEAYEVLSDQQRRQRYDMFGSTDGAVGFGIDDLFNTFFGGETRRRERGPMRGADLRMQIEIELIDSVRGGERVIKVHFTPLNRNARTQPATAAGPAAPGAIRAALVRVPGAAVGCPA